MIRIDSTPGDASTRGRSRRTDAIEAGAFVLALLAWTALASLAVGSAHPRFPLVAGFIVVQDVGFTALAMYLVRRTGEGSAAIGWVRQGALREACLGIGLFVLMVVSVALVTAGLRIAGFGEPVRPPASLLPQSKVDYALAVPLLIIVAVAEETIFRGYLLRRIAHAARSRAVAVVLTSVIFALGHAYQGPIGVVAVGVIGVVLALVYLNRGSLVAPIVMHFIQDFIGLIIAPRFFSG